ncbi:MAG: helix-turn-helix domain-containing protein [Bryobacteraceae bacterium]
MTLAEKFRYLRTVEGHLRGLGRDITQQEIVRAIAQDLKGKISQPYLSQIESGKRKHLTNSSRLLLSKFFKVHPGFLVDDPEGYNTELVSNLQLDEDQLDIWLINGAERFRADPPVSAALLALAKHDDSRRCILLLGEILQTPELLDRLSDVLGVGTNRAQQNKGGWR